jgi:hypothetical protein
MTARRRKRHRPTPPRDERTVALMLKREIVDRFGTWEQCGRWPCYRARACRSPAVACFDEHGETVRELLVDEAYANYRLAGITEDQLPEEWPA